MNSSSLKFQSVSFANPTFASLPAAIIIGIVCGILGAKWVTLNNYYHSFRKAHFDSQVMQVVEVTVLAFVTTSFAFWLPLTDQAKCFPLPTHNRRNYNNLVQYNCPTGYTSAYATLMFNTEGSLIRSLIHGNVAHAYGYEIFTIAMIGTFGAFWYFFSVITYRSAVPSGVFLSMILVGVSVGQMYDNVRMNIFGIDRNTSTILPLMLGAACMMAASTRLSYSIVVLMLETSSAFNMAIPMIFAVFTSKAVAYLINNGLFYHEIRDLQMPMLKGVCPPETARMKAYQIMSKSLITVQSIAEMKSVSKALGSVHNAFPVLNTAGNLVGIIPKNILNELTLQKTFYEVRRLSIASRNNAKKNAETSGSLLERLQEKNESAIKFDINFDVTEGWEATPVDKWLDVNHFNSNIEGQDANCEEALD